MGADQFGRTPVGTGPMKLVDWKPSDRVILQRNENYWMDGADGKALPYLDGITYRLIIDDSVRAIELKSHNIDFTDLIAPNNIADIKADPQLNRSSRALGWQLAPAHLPCWRRSVFRQPQTSPGRAVLDRPRHAVDDARPGPGRPVEVHAAARLARL